MKEEIYWIAFACCPGIGPTTFLRLRSFFGSAKNAWEASVPQLREAGFSEALTKVLDTFRLQFSPDAYAAQLAQKDITIVTQLQRYPVLLRALSRPPIVLFVAGNATLLNESLPLAVVGTRRITSYGQAITEMLTTELVANGVVIVSGLALGVDATAHRACLQAGGKTIAVLGSGVDCPTPRENESLSNTIIASGGCVISEYPLGQAPNKGSFPARNRIIAGLSRGVLITEGARDSGSLITAQEAQKITRPIFAVPGPITSSVSQGPNTLIAGGAHIVTSAADILAELGEQMQKSAAKKRIAAASPEEEKIIQALQNESLSFDEIVRKTSIGSAAIGGILTMMEMKGMLQLSAAGLFSIKG